MSAATSLKRLHRKALTGNRRVSLKDFARELLKEGSDDEKTFVDGWFLNKGPTRRLIDKKDRQSRKGAMIEVQRSATRAAKRKRAAGNKGGGK